MAKDGTNRGGRRVLTGHAGKLALEQCRRAACIIELVQQRRKCILGEFAALLDIRRL